MRTEEANSGARVRTPAGLKGEILSASYTHALVRMDSGGFRRYRIRTLIKDETGA